MPHAVAPMPFEPSRLQGLSGRLLAGHYEINHGEALRRLNAIKRRPDLARAADRVAVSAWHAMGGPTVPLAPQPDRGDAS